MELKLLIGLCTGLVLSLIDPALQKIFPNDPGKTIALIAKIILFMIVTGLLALYSFRSYITLMTQSVTLNRAIQTDLLLQGEYSGMDKVPIYLLSNVRGTTPWIVKAEVIGLNPPTHTWKHTLNPGTIFPRHGSYEVVVVRSLKALPIGSKIAGAALLGLPARSQPLTISIQGVQ